MILVRAKNYAGGIKKCGIHDLMRDLCMRIAEEEKFLKVVNLEVEIPRDYTHHFRHVYIHSDSLKCLAGIHGLLANSLIRSSTKSPNKDLLVRVLHSHQLRVLDAQESPFRKSLDEMVDLVGLRYISSPYEGKNYEIPSSISKLLNLETLVITSLDVVTLPFEIWMMPRIRHIKTKGCFLPYPFDADNMENIVPLENLQTLTGVTNFKLSEDAIQMMPNLKKLRIKYHLDRSNDFSSYFIGNFVLLQRLEALNVFLEDKSNTEFRSYPLPENSSLPPALRNLTLNGFRLSPKHMASIGSLEHLEELNLKRISFDGSIWEPTEGEFLQLKSLIIDETGLEYLTADETNFPVLQSLRIFDCERLMEIPSGIGYIQTLVLILFEGCKQSFRDSVKLIEEEQRALGNDRLQILERGQLIRTAFTAFAAGLRFLDVIAPQKDGNA